MTRRATRPVALALVAALTWTSTPVEAAPPTETRTSKTRGKRAQEPAQPDPAILEQARALSDEAFLRFDTRDYAGAVSLWREAGELLPLDPLYAEYRRHFAIQIAYAYKQSYTFSGEPGELAAAREQFEAYRESLPVDDEANRQLITDELEELDTLAEAAAYSAGDLCRRHAELLKPPRNWELRDVRPVPEHTEPAGSRLTIAISSAGSAGAP